MLMIKIENYQEKAEKYLDILLCSLVLKNWVCFFRPTMNERE